MQFPEDLKYSEDHEWVRSEGELATVGITDYAQDALGDVVYVELPEVGDDCAVGDAVAEVESVKTVSDVSAPVSGEIESVNEELEGNEEIVNEDPYGEGWILRIAMTDPGELDAMMDAAGYALYVAEQD